MGGELCELQWQARGCNCLLEEVEGSAFVKRAVSRFRAWALIELECLNGH